ncbi:MAG: RNA-binding protein [Prevotellaceae bacterium]|jgi:RNA recognition motif-containing protein|nr:RNA-binding protein [Prevotellaceae bacterium]
MNIYVSNLSFDINDSQLQELFTAYGNVTSAKVIIDKYSGRSKGFGFVEMPNDDEAQRAINELNQTDVKGRPINVNEAKPREEKSNSRGGYNRGYRK